MQLVLLLSLILAASAVGAQTRPPMPAFEDQLYMIGRAQEDEIKELRKQAEELRKQVEELKTLNQTLKGEKGAVPDTH